MKAIIVEKCNAEKVKLELMRSNLIDRQYEVKRDRNYVYFPVLKFVKGYKNVDLDLERKDSKIPFDTALKNIFNKTEIAELKRSFEVVGDVAILEIDDKFKSKEKEIAKALLNSSSSIKTVVKKDSNYEGEFRLRSHKFLAGVRKKETIHKENGINVKLNIDKTYFSARLANERLVIAKQIKDSEDVLVMFSGVGVYPIVISKNAKPNLVCCVEINPIACKYTEKNIDLNKIKNIKSFCGDVRIVVPKLDMKFDRIVMPHPHDAVSFLDIALKVLKRNGIIHLYAFYEENKINDIWDEISKYVSNFKKLNLRKCCQVGPNRYRICAEFQVL